MNAGLGDRTQVAIVGAGPAGLMLARLLHLAGIESVVLESQSREYVEHRVRAGVLENGTVELLAEIGVGERMRREGLTHRGIEIRFAGRSHRIDFEDLTGKTITVYGQQEVVKDLIAANLANGIRIEFEAAVEALEDLEGTRPALCYRTKDGVQHRLAADFLAGCDGFHGVSRAAVPAGAFTLFERAYPFAWFGILAESKPVSEELIYANHERGFALVSMRSPTITRLYVQCPATDDVADWSDDRFWTELRARMESGAGGPEVERGPILQKSIAVLRSVVVEPMRHGRLFLAGDAAHIVPPTGAKGMNLAIADVRVLARALGAFYESGTTSLLDAYSETCLQRVWKAQRFSTWMTSVLHRFDDHGPFGRKLQLAELAYVASSHAAAQSLAENYVGLPF
jgi:p-hydroxybenzoate 3-monooxygenase